MLVVTNSLDQKLIDSWLKVADDLGVRVVAPYRLSAPDGSHIDCEAYVPDFGSPSGAVVFSRKTERRERARLRALTGIWRSINAIGSKECLDDWEWFGPVGMEPSWYRAKSAWVRNKC
jgi:hypothetical protein